jgi:hypothetical protein
MAGTADTTGKSDNVPASNKKRSVQGPKKSWAAAYKKRTGAKGGY